MRLVYLSGGITGLGYGTTTNWREHAANELRTVSGGAIGTISPMRGKQYLNLPGQIDRFNGDKAILSSDAAIYRRDRNDVRRCDLVLVNLLEAPRVSIGTVMEIAWADAWDKAIILAMEKDNMHQHPILNQAARLIVPTLEDAIALTYQTLRDDSF